MYTDQVFAEDGNVMLETKHWFPQILSAESKKDEKKSTAPSMT